VTDAPLADRVLAGDPRAIARAISFIENETPEGAAVVSRLYAKSGRAYLIGVTGPPGAGKSTLVDRVIAARRAAGRTVGVLAVDPTSPFSGGAILGDRVRMQAHAEDDGVFIRSMATRGHLGGLARTTAEAAVVLDAAGFDDVVIETVGVGQDEVDIVRTADVSIVTLVPGAGDEVQTLKAGVMEIADIFVVNKADREGADRAAAAIEAMLSLDQAPEGAWRAPVLRCVATTGAGVAELIDTIDRFRARTDAVPGARRRARAEWRLREVLGRTFMDRVMTRVLAPGEFDRLLERIAARETDPYTVAGEIVERTTTPGVDFASSSSKSTPGVVTLDHVGIAVRDVSEFVTLFDRLFGLPTGEPEDVGPHRVRFVDTGDTTVELVEATTDDAPVAKFLRARGSGLHHVCLRVGDIDAAIETLRGRGVRFIDERPRAGAHGSRIAFLHPSSTGGVLVELKQVAHAPR
jgi:LAO/AO transport system kinase